MEKARLTVLCAAILAAGACSGRNVQTATYATTSEARSDGAMEKGYVPSILPGNAYELRAAYAVNGHQRWGLFNFPANASDELRAILEPEEVSLSGTVMDVPGRIEWWPLILRGNIDAERAKITGLRAYHARSGSLVFAVNWSQGRAYYWTR